VFVATHTHGKRSGRTEGAGACTSSRGKPSSELRSRWPQLSCSKTERRFVLVGSESVVADLRCRPRRVAVQPKVHVTSVRGSARAPGPRDFNCIGALMPNSARFCCRCAFAGTSTATALVALPSERSSHGRRCKQQLKTNSRAVPKPRWSRRPALVRVPAAQRLSKVGSAKQCVLARARTRANLQSCSDRRRQAPSREACYRLVRRSACDAVALS
jgi:hypothetical protein